MWSGVDRQDAEGLNYQHQARTFSNTVSFDRTGERLRISQRVCGVGPGSISRGTSGRPDASSKMSIAPRRIILIVEDEILIRLDAAQVLADHGYEVVEADHAAHAIAICIGCPHIDLLFTDVNMPGEMNGIDLAEYLLAERPTLRIIITSALPLLRCVDHLEARFLAKPYEMPKLRDTVAELLAA